MTTAAPREDRAALGLMAMCAAVFFFTCIDTSGKWLILAGLPPLQVVFARYAGHFLLALLVMLPQEGPDALRSNRPWMQFLRAAFLLGSTVLNFTALQFLPITVTTTIMFSMPVVVTLLSIPILGERVGLRRFLAVCTGFLGVLLVMQPWGAQFHPAMFLSLGALVSASCYFVMTRMLAGTESNVTSQLWASGLPTLCLAPFMPAIWIWPESAGHYAVMLAIGIFGGTGHAIATYAHRLADASLLAPVVYVQIIFATAAGVLVFATWPTVWTLAGGLVICASGLYIWQRERSLGKDTTPPDAPRA